MSYTKTTWNSGDVITAEKLNNIESGVEAASSSGSENGPLIVHWGVRSGSGYYGIILDKTYTEIEAAATAGRVVVLITEGVEGIYSDEEVAGACYLVAAQGGSVKFGQYEFHASEFTDDYPYVDMS